MIFLKLWQYWTKKILWNKYFCSQTASLGDSGLGFSFYSVEMLRKDDISNVLCSKFQELYCKCFKHTFLLRPENISQSFFSSATKTQFFGGPARRSRWYGQGTRCWCARHFYFLHLSRCSVRPLSLDGTLFICSHQGAESGCLLLINNRHDLPGNIVFFWSLPSSLQFTETKRVWCP